MKDVMVMTGNEEQAMTIEYGLADITNPNT